MQMEDLEQQDEPDLEDQRVIVDKRVSEEFLGDPEGRVVAEDSERLVSREVLDYRVPLDR